jgi:N-acyl-D-amino-acid deacylase
LTRRGAIREGYHADLVLFDPASVNDPATFDAPCQFASGVDTVIVNGEPIIREGRAVEVCRPLPGRYLRFREG